MNTLIIFICVYIAMISMSFWESYVEGRNAWGKGKTGWKIKLTKNCCLTAYHFYLFFIMWPILLALPLIIYGWNLRLFGILISAYLSGLVIEDFMWFVVNPKVRLSEWNPKFADYYPWIKLGKIHVPLFYIISLFISILSWYLFWR